jgi:DNA-binding LacI/PurR family transcriptional regulator
VLAGRAFTRRGYIPVGYIGLTDSPASRGRFAGLQAALAEAGQTIRAEHIGLIERARRLPDYEELGWSTMRRWLARNTVPRAVLTA